GGTSPAGAARAPAGWNRCLLPRAWPGPRHSPGRPASGHAPSPPPPATSWLPGAPPDGGPVVRGRASASPRARRPPRGRGGPPRVWLDRAREFSRTVLEAPGWPQARFERILELYRARPAGARPSREAAAELEETLKRDLARRDLRPVARREATKWLEVVEMEHGRWRGAPVSASVLATLAAEGNGSTLQELALRLPDSSL